MTSKIFSAVVTGLDAQLVEVEINVAQGLRSFSIVGLPDKAIKESEERVDTAIKSSKLLSPHSRTFKVLVNLAPADLKKEGSLYDLPIALAFLIASKQAKFETKNRMFLGELSLNGNLRPVKGALSFALLANKLGLQEIILPKQNSKEAALIKDLKVIGVESLSEALEYLEGKKEILPTSLEVTSALLSQNQTDISWIQGQEYAKRALEITAAGAHNLFMFGPPGSGKSLLAKSLPSILPQPSFEESLEITKIYSISGLMEPNQTMISFSPFRSPHHSSSEASLLGGGSSPKAGEITLAHRGVLFLDEFPEFHRDVLESLRQPIEEGKITVSRAKHTFTFPSKFMMVAASNPCPCGYLNDPDKPCSCSPSQVAMYQRKLSGPLMDRMDLFIEVPAVKYEKLIQNSSDKQSEKIRDRVQKARKIQKERFAEEQILTNSEMNIPQIRKYCQHNELSKTLLKKYVDSGKLSARGYHRVLKVARTIADLMGSENLQYEHVAEALMYRVKD